MGKYTICVCVLALISSFLFSEKVDGKILEEAFDLNKVDNIKLPSGWKYYHFQGNKKVALTGSVTNFDNRSALVIKSEMTGRTLDTYCVPVKLDQSKDRLVRVSFKYKLMGKIRPMFLISSVAGAGNPAIKQRPSLKQNNDWMDCVLEYDVQGFPRDVVFEILIEGDVEAGARFAIDDLLIESVDSSELKVEMSSPASSFIVSDEEISPILLDVKSPGNLDLYVQARNSKGAIVYSDTFEKINSGRVSISVKEWDWGKYVLNVKCDKINLEKNWPVEIVPNKNPSVLIRGNRIKVNGKPFFPIALFRTGDPIVEKLKKEPLDVGKLTRDSMFKQLSERGFNTVHYSWRTPPIDYFDDALRNNLMVVSETNYSLEDIPRIRDHPALLGYYYADEPLPSAVKKLRSVYLKYKKLDPYHPVMTAINNESVGFGGHRFIDIALPDPYPISGYNSSLKSVVPAVRNSLTMLNNSDPCSTSLIVPQLFTASLSNLNGFEPTYEQLRANTYGGIAAGAKGVFYFGFWTHEKLDMGMSKNPERKYWYLPDSSLWDRVGGLNSELKILSPIFLSDNSEVVGFETSDVVGRMWLHQGKVTLVIVNLNAESKGDLQFELPVKVNQFESRFGSNNVRRIPSNDLQYTVRLQGYDVVISQANIMP